MNVTGSRAGSAPAVGRHVRRRRRAGMALLLALVVVACGGRSTATPETSDTTTLVVHAAASLTGVLDDLSALVERRHPDIDVRANLAGSQALAAQLAQGAPGGVFISANPAQFERVASLLDGPGDVLATNQLVVVVSTANPADVTALADLADPKVTVALGAPGVPAGDYAREVLARAGITATVVTEELDVRSVVRKVAAGEVDAGIAYATDVVGPLGAGVEAVPIPPGDNVVAEVRIGVIAGDQADAGARFVAVALGLQGQQLLADAGFTPAAMP